MYELFLSANVPDHHKPRITAEAAIDILMAEKEYKRIIVDQLNTIAALKAALRAALRKEVTDNLDSSDNCWNS